MAGDWIKMRGNLWNDPRISKICDITEQSEAAVVGGLYWLWATADQHTEDGVLPGLSMRQIDRKTGIQGLGEALLVIGWIADHPEGIRIVNFEEHNGASAKKRCQTAKRVANHKSINAPLTQTALPEKQDSVSSALPREEKRREEKSINTLEPNGSSQNMPESGSFDPSKLDFENLKPEKPKKTGLPDCPYGLILDLWGKHLPHLPQPRIWEGNRKQTMRQRWAQAAKPSDYSTSGYANESEGLEWWGEFFEYIAKHTTLANGFESKGRTWKPDLPWVCNAENFQKIIDGKYDK